MRGRLRRIHEADVTQHCGKLPLLSPLNVKGIGASVMSDIDVSVARVMTDGGSRCR